MLPKPVVEQHDRFKVVRDDLLPGGTKMRFILPYLEKTPAYEIVYASPAYGFAQVALAYCCKELGKQATIFTAQRKEVHPLTRQAHEAGAKVVLVPNGYLNVVQKRATEYCNQVGAYQVPFGVNVPEAMGYLVAAIKETGLRPKEVWCAAGSGTLTRALQEAWPKAKHHAVLVGKSDSDIGNAVKWVAPMKFEQDAKVLPPYPSCINYDAKVWQFVTEHGSDNALIWNVAR